jgi:intracellular sulfur oxidation DsrE/DsrF family protein
MMQRSVFLGSSLALAVTAASPREAEAMGLVETAREFDLAAFTRLVSREAEIRQVWDAGKLYPPILGAVKNALNGLQFGFGIAPDRLATAFVTHSGSNLLLYNDEVWAAYHLGELFSVQDPSGAVVTSNIFAQARGSASITDPSDVHGRYQDASIAALQKRGVMFFLCNTSVVQHAHQIVSSGVAKTQNVDDVARTLRRSLLPGVMLVPNGFSVVAYLQSHYRYGYATES